MLSIAGLGLVLWSIIEAPAHGWSSALVVGTGITGLAVLAGFAVWERVSSHPMLNLAFFREPSFSAAVVLAGCVLALMTLPARPRADGGQASGDRPPRQHQATAR